MASTWSTPSSAPRPTRRTAPPGRSGSTRSSSPTSARRHRGRVPRAAADWTGIVLIVVFLAASETQRGANMATVEQHLPETHNGIVGTGEGVPVENPATGEIIATVRD